MSIRGGEQRRSGCIWREIKDTLAYKEGNGGDLFVQGGQQRGSKRVWRGERRAAHTNGEHLRVLGTEQNESEGI